MDKKNDFKENLEEDDKDDIEMLAAAILKKYVDKCQKPFLDIIKDIITGITIINMRMVAKMSEKELKKYVSYCKESSDRNFEN